MAFLFYPEQKSCHDAFCFVAGLFRGYLDSIVVVTSNNVATTYEVGEKIISELSVCGFDEIYFLIRKEIIL